jgi:hypothetical protein
MMAVVNAGRQRPCPRTQKSLRRPEAGAGQSGRLDSGKIGAPGAIGAARGNEGVGEHVRTRFHLRLASRSGLEAGEIADRKDPHRTKKTCFFCRTDFDQSELFSKMRSSRLT